MPTRKALLKEIDVSNTNPTVSICRWLNDAPFAYSMTYEEGTVDALANALHETDLQIELAENPVGNLWLQACTLDRRGSDKVQTVKIAAENLKS